MSSKTIARGTGTRLRGEHDWACGSPAAAKYLSAFRNITLGNNAIFTGACCQARAGNDLDSGLGSPLADSIADNLPGQP